MGDLAPTWPPGRSLRLATRGSPLARWQADAVAAALTAARPGVDVESVVVRTTGDQRADVPLDQLGGQGVFVAEIRAAVLDGRADLAVHSAKDLPSAPLDGLVLAAVPPRADPRDALVGTALDALPTGAVVATGSARRRAQLANLRPDLGFTTLRGNMDTRVRRGEDGSVAAVVVALAAMDRLGWHHRVTDVLSPTVMLPQVGQGALAVECRADDHDLLGILGAIDDVAAHRAVRAERAMLAAVGGSCTLPVGALAEADGTDGGLWLRGFLGSGDGRIVLRAERRGTDPEVLGARMADDLLQGCGGAALDLGGDR